MSDILRVFGQTYPGVTSIKAKNTDSETIVFMHGESTAILQEKTDINPTTSSQTITPDQGYDGLSSVQINAMPSGTAGTPTATKGSVSNHQVSVTPSVTNTTGYITGSTISGTAVTVTASELASGNKSITENGTDIDVVGYSTVSVEVSGGGSPSLQAKTNINPSTSSQTIEPDSGYDGLSSVQINAMPSMTLPTSASSSGSGTTTATISRSTSDQYINIPTGYNASAANYKVSAVANGTAGTPTASKGSVSNNSITVTPSVTNTTGYISGGTLTGTGVSVSASELVSGNKSITENGTNIDVTNYATVSVDVEGGSVTIVDTEDPAGGTIRTITFSGTTIALQGEKSVTPSESEQTIEPDTGYDGFTSVVVDAISSTYVGSGVTSRSSSDLTASGATVTAPAGYYASDATKSVTTMTLPTTVSSSATSGYSSKATVSRSTSAQYINIPPGYNSAGGYYTISAVPNGTATAPSSISGTSATVSTGTNTLTLSKTVSVTPSISTAGYISSGTAGNSSVSLTASVTTKGATTYTPSGSSQTIASSTYLTGTQTIEAVTTTNLTAANIASGVTVKVGTATDDDSVTSVTGSLSFINVYTGSSAPSSSLGSNGDIYIQS